MLDANPRLRHDVVRFGHGVRVAPSTFLGRFVPISVPSAARCNPKGAANARPCPMPTPTLPGLREDGTEDLCRVAGLVRQRA